MSGFIKGFIILVIVIGLFTYAISQFPNFLKSGGSGGKTSFFGINFNPLKQFGSSTISSNSGNGKFGLPQWKPVFSSGASFGLPSFGFGSYISPSGSNNSQISPYYGRVRLSGLSSSITSGNGQTQVSFSLAPGESANLSGWHIRGNRADIIISQAVNVYNPYGSASEGDIIVSGSGSVNIYTGTSPLGVNLRLNQCTGYLNNSYSFSPSLPTNCPAPFSKSEVTSLVGYCQNVLLSLGNCQLPSASLYNNLPATSDGNICREYLNKVNFKNCYDKYNGSTNFLMNTWIVWGGPLNFDPYHDQVKFLDRNGLLVSEYNY